MNSKMAAYGAFALAAGLLVTRMRGSNARPSAKKGVEVADLPVIDLATFFDRESNEGAALAECEKAAKSLHEYGCLVVRDPRVSEADNSRFLDMMEKYFDSSDGVRDARPELGFQVGVTPEFKERPRNHCERASRLPAGNGPLTLCPPELDPKWRFFWRIGAKPKSTEFEQLNADPVIPAEFPEWTKMMDLWGGKMVEALFQVAKMSALGFGLPEDTFYNMMQEAPHLLAPTGSDFSRYGSVDTVLAGYHYDLNMLTIHGKSRFPGLFIWTRDGQRVLVKVPDNCLLVQAGKQLEYLTGGHVLAGFHEVVVTPQTVQRIDAAKAKKSSLWRVSSTLFGHIASDQVLEPQGKFSSEASRSQFPPIKAGDQVMAELAAIKLGKGFAPKE